MGSAGDDPHASARERHWLVPIGVGCSGAGLVLAAWGLTAPFEGSTYGDMSHELHAGVRWTALGLCVLAATWALLRFGPRLVPEGARLAGSADRPLTAREMAVAALAVMVRTQARRRMTWRVVAVAAGAVVLAVGVLAAAGELSREIGAGVPRVSAPVLAGFVLALAGIVLLVIAPLWEPAPARPPRRRAVALGAAIAVTFVVVTATLAVSNTVARAAVEASTAPAGSAPRSLLDHPPERVVWTWDDPRPQDADLMDRGLSAVAAGAGVAVAQPDGVVALDGRTGQERWHYRRPGAELVDLTGSRRGRWLRASFVSSDDHGPSVVVTIDGRTGEVGTESYGNSPDRGVDIGEASELTEHALVFAQHRGVTALSPKSGDPMWSGGLPRECVLADPYDDGPAAGHDAVFMLVRCDADGTEVTALLALDDRNGAVRWRYDIPADGPDADVYVSPGGGAVDLVWSAGLGEISARTAVYLDAATGDVLALPRDFGDLGADESDEGWVADIHDAAPAAGAELHGTGVVDGTVVAPHCEVAGSVPHVRAAGDALLALCMSDGSEIVDVSVAPSSGDAPWSIPVSSPGAVRAVVVTPTTVVLAQDGRLTALG